MNDIEIDLTTGQYGNHTNGRYMSAILNDTQLTLCKDITEELFDITKSKITLLISEVQTENSYGCKLTKYHPNSSIPYLYLTDTKKLERIQLLINTGRYFKQNYPKVFNKPLYVSILE